MKSNEKNVDPGNLFSGEDEIDLKEIWRIIRSFRKSIVLIFVSVLLLTIYITMTSKPVFEATTVVMVKESGLDAGTLMFDFGSSGSQQRLQNEIEVIKSYYLHDQVVQSLIEDGSSEDLALFGTRYVRKRYRLIDFFLGWVQQKAEPQFQSTDLDFQQRIAVVENLRYKTRTTSIREADVLKIAVSSTDSIEAIFLANRISSIYQNLDLTGGQGELHFVLAFLDSQIVKYEERLDIVEENLRQFQADNQIYSISDGTSLLLNNLTFYEKILYTNIAEMEVSQERIEYLQRQLSESEQALLEQIVNTNNPMIVALRKRIAETEAQKVHQMVDEGWDDNSLQARDFDRRISEMKEKLTSTTESLILSGWSEEDPFRASQEIFNKIIEQQVELHAAASRADEYQKLVDDYSTRLGRLPDQTMRYARLERELQLNESLYLTMKQKFEESRITEAGQMGKVRILDPALVAVKINPNIKMNLLVGIVLGFGIGIGYAFLREFMDNTVKAVEQLERKGLTTLGIIPDMHHQASTGLKKASINPPKGGTDFRSRLITYEDPKSPISESYRTLRTNVTYASADKKIKSLLISSPQPGEGKSTTTANLAIAFAQLRRRTLLVDADLRKPVQHNVFDKPRGQGLAEYLIGEVNEVDSIIHPTKVDSLFIITAGDLPPNPSELLGSNRMSQLVKQLEQDWDMILFDSPPIVAVTDASMISAEIDAIAMVVKAGQTDRAAVDRALDTMRNVKAPLIGVILNGANPETLAGKYSYYYSYYNYYYSSDEKK
jgi:capsular exopolysaccharide synthesis family protein